ncbi:MAG: tRNA lysidine(34) synthetase TilS [Acidobacteria bacterium]|nr:MAG: tRNA lysidine(34) synthetase TilS [Acidobacteriota bacterium]
MTRQEKVQKRQQNSSHAIKHEARLSAFARSLLREWRKLGLPQSGARVVVAVSGGADSSTLMLALDELVQSEKLKINPIVAHLNHKLRGKASDADSRWVRGLAKQLGHQVVTAAIDVKKRALRSGDNLEQAARRARYEFLTKTAKAKKAKFVVTAHTMDDQAETVLLNLLRGTGPDGLAGIDVTRALKSGSDIVLTRPLLSWATRADTESYGREHAIDFRVDETNADETRTRVRVRRQLLPLLKTFNPKFVERLAHTIEILREDNLALDAAALRLLDLSSDQHQSGRNRRPTSLRADLLRFAPPALRRRALRLWLARVRGDLRRLDSAHIFAIEKLLASTSSGRLVELPGQSTVSRKDGLIHFHAAKSKGRART